MARMSSAASAAAWPSFFTHRSGASILGTSLADALIARRHSAGGCLSRRADSAPAGPPSRLLAVVLVVGGARHGHLAALVHQARVRVDGIVVAPQPREAVDLA